MPNSINLALKKSTTSSGYVKPYESARAVDGLYSTTNQLNRWLCNGVSISTPAKLTVDLGSISVINRWVVRHMCVAGWRAPDYNMSNFTLQTSVDSVNWINVDNVVGNVSSLTDKSISALVVGRYVRLSITRGLNTNPQLASLMEFEVYGYATPYLSSLTVNNGQIPISPLFAPQTFAYTIADVSNSTSSISVTPNAQDPRANIKVNGVSVASGSATSVGLNVGSNTINIVVTAVDGTTIQAYTLTVVRKAPASQYLSNLQLSNGTLNPNFAGRTTFAYTANVANTIASITVTPTAEDSAAKITVNGTSVASGSASASISLNVGTNTITVVSTAADNSSSQTYTLTVNRVGLTSLTTSVVLDQTFAPNNEIYTASVGYDTADINVTPVTNINGATITVNGINVTTIYTPSKYVTDAGGVNAATSVTNSNNGSGPVIYESPVKVLLTAGVDNIITIKVTSGSVTENYTITVKKSSNTQLKNLLSNRPVSPALPPPLTVVFNPTQYTYTGSVLSSIATIQLTPTLQDTNATIAVDGTVKNSSGVISNLTVNVSGTNYVVTFGSGTNTINIKVTPAFGIVKGVYTLTITKP